MKKRVLICLVTVFFTLCLVMPSASANNLAIERQIFTFVTEEMGLNSAVACGILANIEAESNFSLTIVGDKGTSFGLCQWHNTRYDDLRAFCRLRGYDYRSLEGQMNFMAFELKTTYQGVYATLLNVPDTADGAYTAAYFWCYYYERPADLEGASLRRGRNAQFKYWLRYGGTASGSAGSFDSSGYSGALYDGFTEHSFYWDAPDESDAPIADSAVQMPIFIEPETDSVIDQNQQPETGQDTGNKFQYVPHHLPAAQGVSAPVEMVPIGCLFITATPIRKWKWEPEEKGESLPEDWDGQVADAAEQASGVDVLPGEEADGSPEVACGT